jgi:hypothetical protein
MFAFYFSDLAKNREGKVIDRYKYSNADLFLFENKKFFGFGTESKKRRSYNYFDLSRQED